MNISEETIDSFLRGDLSGTELTAFNEAVAADPKLQQEVSIQKDIIDSVKQYRHQQLKDRLNAIDVKPVAVPFYASPYFKFAASIGVVAILVGSFSLFTQKEHNTTIAVESSAKNGAATIITEETGSTLVPSPNTQTGIETAKTVSINKKTDSKENTSSRTSSTEKSNNVSNAKSTKSDAGTAYEEFAEETVDTDNTNEGVSNNFDMPTMNHGGGASNVSSPQIKVSIVKENNLGYRFFNNQLFLHGNFSNSPYELFELNNKPSKQLFLYFENNYYELIQGKTKVTSLTPITNKAILLQLTQLREH